jgi:beta-alanine degradation protein BauB
MEKTTNNPRKTGLDRRQATALLAAFGVSSEVLAQDAPTADPRAYRVVLDNEQVRVLEYKSRPGLGVCGQGMHYHPAHVTVSLTGAKLKKTENGKVSFVEVPPGHIFFAGEETHSAEIIGGSGTRTYIIELKGNDWKPSTNA